MLKFRRTESMNIDVWILFADVLQKINVPLEWQFRMVPALHQNLDSACGSEFIQLFIELLETKHVMIFVALRSVKRRSLRSEEHTSELQSLRHLVCRLLL